MSTKRKHADEPETDKKRSVDGFFHGLTFHLYPAALGKARRAIFEKQIDKHGGKRVESLEATTASELPLLVLIEDSTSTEEKRLLWAKKCLEVRNYNAATEIVGMSWLSKCLEEKDIVSRDKFRLDPAIRTEKAKVELVMPESVKEPVLAPAEEGSSSSPPKPAYIDRVKHKFVCAQSSDNPTHSNLNGRITAELEKLAAAYKSTNDTWRAFGYQKAIAAIKNYPRPITSREEASKIPQVGKKMADKIIEIIEEGKLQKVEEVCESEQVQTISLFARVWGVGPTTAEQWYRQGLRTLEDLETKANLNRQQKVGLKHFHDLDERMKREECTEIYDYVKEAALSLQPGLDVIACGSYRRLKETCGDLDILITHPDKKALEGIFDRVLDKLRGTGFLTDDLTVQRDGRQRKYLGVCRLLKPGAKHRRLDVIVVPWDERACALMYFTGSAHCNRSMRLLAIKMGMSLSEHALVENVARRGKEKLNEGAVVPTPTEESVFEALGLPYREPHERNH